jgi:hypothetical protein
MCHVRIRPDIDLFFYALCVVSRQIPLDCVVHRHNAIEQLIAVRAKAITNPVPFLGTGFAENALARFTNPAFVQGKAGNLLFQRESTHAL